MITAVKEHRRQDKQQIQIKQQALLTTKIQCQSIFFFEKYIEKVKIASEKT